VKGPTGTYFHPKRGGSGIVKFMFFGADNNLLLLDQLVSGNSVDSSVGLIDFTTTPPSEKPIIFQTIGSTTTPPPRVQYSAGMNFTNTNSGKAFLIFSSTGSEIQNLAIYRSDNGTILCPGPPPFAPTLEIRGEATATQVRIKHGGTIIAACQLPFAPPPATETLSVPIRWCVIAKDTDGDGAFDPGEAGAPAFTSPANVGERDTDNVLWRRHERATDKIYLAPLPKDPRGANVIFRSALWNIVEDPILRFPIIPDQKTSPGSTQVGDVLDLGLGDVGTDEWNATYNACLAAWEPRRVGDIGIVAIVARKIVNARGTPTGVLGWGPFGMRKLLVEDNAFSLPGSGLIDSSLLDPVDALLGHEIGHTLASLRHMPSPVVNAEQAKNLMGPTGVDLSVPPDQLLDNIVLSRSVSDETGATVDQINLLRTAAQAAPGCRIAGTDFRCGSSMSDVRTDTVGDVADRFLDISALFVTDTEPSGTTRFAHELFGIFTDQSVERFESLEFFVLADLDNDASTGGAPADLGIPTTFQGAELVTRVQVFRLIESPLRVVTVPTVWQFRAGAFVEVVDPSIQSRVDESVSTIHNGGTATDVHSSDAVVIEFSNTLRGPVSLPFRLQALAVGTPTMGPPVIDRLDEAEQGKTFRLREPTFPLCSVIPNPVPAGGLARVSATGLLPNRGVHAVFGDQTVATNAADAAGSATLDFDVPPTALQGLHLVTVGTDGTALTADCVVMIPATGVVDRFSGIAHGVGRGSTRTGISMVGTFLLDGEVDLGAVPATLTISSLLNDGARDVAGLPLTLLGDHRNNANVARFNTPVGTLPIAKVTIGAKGGGRFTFRVDVAKATIEPPSLCPTTNLTTSFTINDGISPPVTLTTLQPWLCFGAGNKYLKSPPP
jgi:hypothetical protein